MLKKKENKNFFKVDNNFYKKNLKKGKIQKNKKFFDNLFFDLKISNINLIEKKRLMFFNLLKNEPFYDKTIYKRRRSFIIKMLSRKKKALTNGLRLFFKNHYDKNKK